MEAPSIGRWIAHAPAQQCHAWLLLSARSICGTLKGKADARLVLATG